MSQVRNRVLGGAALTVALLAAEPAQAASLQPVANWGASGVPSTASMYIYVPDKLAARPPILVLAHSCGGTASGVLGEAHTIVDDANKYGFIMVVPQTSKNCWDVGSTKALTHDGGGDTQAIAQMVKYALTTYKANADRVYVTGDSSGGMMTQGLLAVYPDIFKAGSAFAGVPAGCWAVGDPDGSWSSQCAGGVVTHTPLEWGNLARGMYPTYSGHRPRVQLFHGDADPTINFANFTEAIKQWTNVLGLSTAPTSTDTVMLGGHQATRQRWQNSCGYVVLDAFRSLGGNHGPSDAIFNASFVVPFLGLDKTDAVDPEVAQCNTGGMGGTGGTGGATSSGGSGGNGGAPTTGGGATGLGGQPGTAGAVGAGGAPPGMGGSETGGSTPSDGGSNASAGSNAAAGSTVVAGASGSSATPADNGGCSCSVVGDKTSPGRALPLAFLALFVLRGRRVARLNPRARRHWRR